MTAVLPELAEAAVDRDERAYIARFREGLSLLLTFLVPAAVGLLFIARPLIEMFLQRGSFDSIDTARTADMLRAFAYGLPAFSVYLYCVRAFFARRDTRTPFFLSVVQNVLNVALVVPLTGWLGPDGLAVAYTASYWFIALVALLVLHRRIPHLLTTRALFPLLRSVGVGAAVTVALLLTSFLLGDGDRRPVTELVAMLAVATFVFVPTTVLLKPRGFEPAVARLRQGMRGRGRTMAG
jgi:putative peptidoglycan lipid II flippase